MVATVFKYSPKPINQSSAGTTVQIVKLCTKEKKNEITADIYGSTTSKNEKKQKRRARFFTQTQTLYQYGIASSTVLLGTMLVRAARRARSRLHMGQEEILGVFNHVYLVIKKRKKNGEFLNSTLWWGK